VPIESPHSELSAYKEEARCKGTRPGQNVVGDIHQHDRDTVPDGQRRNVRADGADPSMASL
jgi:hypothetical protein